VEFSYTIHYGDEKIYRKMKNNLFYIFFEKKLDMIQFLEYHMCHENINYVTQSK
jgi:hypothetical protein